MVTSFPAFLEPLDSDQPSSTTQRKNCFLKKFLLYLNSAPTARPLNKAGEAGTFSAALSLTQLGPPLLARPDPPEPYPGVSPAPPGLSAGAGGRASLGSPRRRWKVRVGGGVGMAGLRQPDKNLVEAEPSRSELGRQESRTAERTSTAEPLEVPQTPAFESVSHSSQKSEKPQPCPLQGKWP